MAITKAAFRPVVHISRTTESIMDGCDLKKRVALPAARDEIFQMAKVMDTMLERLEASFERERRFTSDAAHELRTPIAAIMAQSEMGLDGGDMEDERDDSAFCSVSLSKYSSMAYFISEPPVFCTQTRFRRRQA